MSNRYTRNKDFLIEVAKGNVQGHSIVNKYGHNPAVATTGEDVWGGGGTYAFYPSTAQTMELVSTSVEDKVGGTGATQVVVEGLDGGGFWQTETIIPNGTTAVALTKTYTRMFRAYSGENPGSTGTNVGAITVKIVTVGTVAIYIGAADGQTQHAIYTVPRGKKAYFLKGYVQLANADKNGQDGTFKWKARVENGSWLTKGEAGLVNIGASQWQYEYGAPNGPIPGMTDIKIEMSVCSAEMHAVAGFDLLLVDD